MKNITLIIFLVLVFSMGICFAIEEDVTVTWDYDNPPVDLAGFELRINEDNATIIELESDQRTWAGTLSLKEDVNSLELRAKDLGGQVSEWSIAHYDPAPGTPHITCITFQAR